MTILVTGATGFIGQHVIRWLLASGHTVVATAPRRDKAQTCDWFGHVTFVPYTLSPSADPQNLYELLGRPDALIHLAWQGLPNYKSVAIHFEQNLFPQYYFLTNLIRNGLQSLTVTGTCFEYGMQSGCLSEDLPTAPANPYALAKDTLRKFLEALQQERTFSLKWLRLFYMYGPGQSLNSLIPLLEKAIDRDDTVFNMSGGEQLRDFLPIEEVVRTICTIALKKGNMGAVNCCSGRPISVRRLVEQYISERGAQIKLNLGHYPYPDYEPMAFWGDNQKLTKILKKTMRNPIEEFKQERAERIASYANQKDLKEAAAAFNLTSNRDKYSYNFSWLGRPIIQYPQDMVAMQELIWDLKPDLIIETGIAHGGSLVFYASILELIGKGIVLGIDIDIREHNRREIEAHPMFRRMEMLQGSAIDEKIVAEVAKRTEGKQTIIVCLDSNHTHEHVLRELELYSPFVTKDSYLVVFDTIVEDLPAGSYDRPWNKGNNPKTAVWEFLKTTDAFEIDQSIDNKLLISVAPEGYLKRVK